MDALMSLSLDPTAEECRPQDQAEMKRNRPIRPEI